MERPHKWMDVNVMRLKPQTTQGAVAGTQRSIIERRENGLNKERTEGKINGPAGRLGRESRIPEPLSRSKIEEEWLWCG